MHTVESTTPAEHGYRWTICALLFFATTINYVDRAVMGLLAPTLQKEIGWTESDYGTISASFTFAYAIGFLCAGQIMDRIGVKKGFAAAIVTWSLAAMSSALATSVGGFAMARAALGFGESGNFPGAIKTIAEWFPKRERALATGIFNAGSNVGAFAAPIIVTTIALRWGWRWTFIVTGLLGFIWLIAWLLVYETPERNKRLGASELAWIRSDPKESTAEVPWGMVLRKRQLYAFIVGKALTDPVWWFYLFWLPKFLDKQFAVKLDSLALPLVAIYLVADFGSVGGGWMSSRLIKSGRSVNFSRKITMLCAAVIIIPTMLAPAAHTLWGAVALVSIAAAAHQWWSCNLFTMATDLFPRRAVATVVGLGGFSGAMAGVVFQKTVGNVLQTNPGDYQRIFVYCGTIYVVALLTIHLISPKMEQASLDVGAGAG